MNKIMLNILKLNKSLFCCCSLRQNNIKRKRRLAKKKEQSQQENNSKSESEELCKFNNNVTVNTGNMTYYQNSNNTKDNTIIPINFIFNENSNNPQRKKNNKIRSNLVLNEYNENQNKKTNNHRSDNSSTISGNNNNNNGLAADGSSNNESKNNTNHSTNQGDFKVTSCLRVGSDFLDGVLLNNINADIQASDDNDNDNTNNDNENDKENENENNKENSNDSFSKNYIYNHSHTDGNLDNDNNNDNINNHNINESSNSIKSKNSFRIDSILSNINKSLDRSKKDKQHDTLISKLKKIDLNSFSEEGDCSSRNSSLRSNSNTAFGKFSIVSNSKSFSSVNSSVSSGISSSGLKSNSTMVLGSFGSSGGSGNKRAGLINNNSNNSSGTNFSVGDINTNVEQKKSPMMVWNGEQFKGCSNFEEFQKASMTASIDGLNVFGGVNKDTKSTFNSVSLEVQSLRENSINSLLD